MSASSSPSPSTSPLDDGITTVKHYIYIHTNLNPRTNDTTKKYHYHCKTTSNANPTAFTPAPVLTYAVQRCVDTAAEAIATHREARLIFIQGLVRRILREAYRESTSPPFSWDSISTECLCWDSFNQWRIISFFCDTSQLP